MQFNLPKKVIVVLLGVAILFGNEAIVAVLKPILDSVMIHLPA